ncbi:hypothetical protein [Nocardia sp. NBC_00403]|uniref:hypothetical protein n=1 Tax=Nocardia sp. NBC_00403 TaxID=2975990 RepID=UPI002E20CEF3
MRRKMFRAVVVALSGAAVVAGWPAMAFADVNQDPVGGRERVKVTVTSTELDPLGCSVTVDGGGNRQIDVPAGGRQSVLISQVAPGIRWVHTVCYTRPPAPAFPKLVLDSKLEVAVDLANPVLDGVDGMLVGGGSGTLTTDPALR